MLLGIHTHRYDRKREREKKNYFQTEQGESLPKFRLMVSSGWEGS